jgi:DivIVA domain-containing protein
VSAAERGRMRDDVRDVSFPLALRGYDRAAVDRYVEQVNRLIAELEISSSPESAVRHALEEVSEETRGLLERAQETADEITRRSRAKADDRLQRGEREAEEVREAASREAEETLERSRRESQALHEAAARAAREVRETAARDVDQLRATAEREVEEMRAAAEARVQELGRNAEGIWQERRRLLEEMSAVAEQLAGIADAEAARFPRALEATAEGSSPPGEPVAEEDFAAAEESPAVPPEGAERNQP